MGLLGAIKADRLINQVVSSGDLENASSKQSIDKLRGLSRTAIPKLIGLLSTTRREESELVIRLLTQLVSTETLECYFQGLTDADSRVVSGVVRALQKAHKIDPNQFLTLFDNPDVSKSAILQILSAHKSVLNGERLIRYAFKLEQNDLVMLYRIIEDIANEAMLPTLINRIDAKNPVMRAQIAKVLSKFKSDAAQDALHRLLEDGHKLVRLAALESLSQMDANMDVARLCKMIKDPDLKIQSKAIDAIVKLNHPRTVQYLLEPLQDESEYARRGAVEILNEIGNASAIKDLLIAIKDRDWWVRSRAADALGNIGGKKVVEAVIALIKDDDEFVRRSAVEIINATKDNRTYDALIKALEDSDWWVRERAIDGLAALGNQKAVPVLIDLLNKEQANSEIVLILIRALAQLGSKVAIKPILEQLRSGVENVQREALGALQQLTDESHAQTVIKSIVDSTENADPEIRELANQVIKKINTLRSGTFQKSSAETQNLQKPSASTGEEDTIVMPGTVSRGAAALATEEVDPTKLQPNDILANRYRYIKQVGRGAFGSVHLVEDLMVNEQLILKFLNAQVASDHSIIKRFVYELRFARKVTHKNVIRIYDLITFGESPAISMEYFPSHTLNAEMQSGQPMHLKRALKIIGDVCSGMKAAHQASVVHRDLKPSNIMIDDTDLVKIVDFGVAAATRQMDTKLTRTGLLIGTPTYMAPEQVLGRDVDARTDIYSLGVIMYELMTGRPPYSGGDSMAIMYQHVQGQAVPPRDVNPKLPHTMSAVVQKAMSIDVNKRYQSMAELKERIDAFDVE